jgi:guanyl-specific ribonuclease Sa
MRRHHWFIAALLLLGLWAWTQRSHNGSLHAPTAPAPTVAVPADRPPPSLPTALPPLATPSATPSVGQASRYPAFLPREAAAVLDDIARGGPYDYRQDGNVFQNRERLLPAQPRGYYREFTVPTPGSDDRGPRRIVTGGDPPREYWYSADHYRSFRRFDVGNGASR